MAGGPEVSRVATFASLTAAGSSLGRGAHRLLDNSDDSEERRTFYLAYGVREDCLALLQMFEAEHSLRYQDFAACWRAMLFSHVLSGRSVPTLRVEYLQKLMAIVVKLFVSGQNTARKIGSLYLLYGLYMKLNRGEKALVSIRVTPGVWAELKRVRQLAVDRNHHDVLYVIDKLLFVSAFSFVASEVELAPDLLGRLARSGVVDAAEGEAEPAERPLQEYLDDGGLRQLSTLHDKYEAIKRQVLGGAPRGRDPVPAVTARLEAVARGLPPPPPDRATPARPTA